MSAAKRSPATKPTSRKRFSAAERAKILAAAKKANLTGKQVAAKYGISMVTYYVWKKQAGQGGHKAPTRTSGFSGAAESKLRAVVRAKVTRLLPRILKEEVDRILGG